MPRPLKRIKSRADSDAKAASPTSYRFGIPELDRKLRRLPAGQLRAPRLGMRPPTSTFYGSPPDLIDAPEVEIADDGSIVPRPTPGSRGRGHSYWRCFTSSLDRRRDVELLKEVVFWKAIYHPLDAMLDVSVPGFSGDQFVLFKRAYAIGETPALVVSGSPDFSAEYAVLHSELLDPSVVGDDLAKLRDLLEFLHHLVVIDGGIRKARRKLIYGKIRKILRHAWDGRVGLSIGLG